jgi:hypothetical protein
MFPPNYNNLTRTARESAYAYETLRAHGNAAGLARRVSSAPVALSLPPPCVHWWLLDAPLLLQVRNSLIDGSNWTAVYVRAVPAAATGRVLVFDRKRKELMGEQDSSAYVRTSYVDLIRMVHVYVRIQPCVRLFPVIFVAAVPSKWSECAIISFSAVWRSRKLLIFLEVINCMFWWQFLQLVNCLIYSKSTIRTLFSS